MKVENSNGSEPSEIHDSLAFLAEFTDYEQKNASSLKRDSLDLRRMRDLAQRLGNPQDSFSVIHIAGSKGKGSTTLITEALIRGMGLKTGTFLSPHVMSVTERIALNGQNISPRQFARLADRLRPLVAELRSTPEKLPSFFESITLMAFLAFQENEVDVAVVETGLGGRLDATNIVKPFLSMITMIDLEHTRVLGDTLVEIAGEKAGIIKPGVPVICGEDSNSPAGQTIGQIAESRKSELFWLDQHVDVETKDLGEAGQLMTFGFEYLHLSDLHLGYYGEHQAANTAMALAAVAQLIKARQLTVNEEGIRQALMSLRLPARLEFFPARTTSPALPYAVLLDSAHTPMSVRALSRTLATTFSNYKLTFLVGLLRDKNVENCLDSLKGQGRRFLVTEPDSPRAMPAAELKERAAKVLGSEIEIEILDSQQKMPTLPEHAQNMLVVTGSVYLAGSIRQILMPVEDSGRSR